MSLAGLSKEEAFMHGWEVATQRAISRAELGLPLEYGKPGGTRPMTTAEVGELAASGFFNAVVANSGLDVANNASLCPKHAAYCAGGGFDDCPPHTAD